MMMMMMMMMMMTRLPICPIFCTSCYFATALWLPI